MIKLDRRERPFKSLGCLFLMSVLVLMSFPVKERMKVDECERFVRFVVLVLDLYL